MNLGEIVKDSLRYPFSDWKNFLILGIIVLLSGLTSIDAVTSLLTKNISAIWVLGIIEFLIGFCFYGYLFKVIKSSLNGNVELPEFGDWFEIFINGIKVNIALIVYSIPAFLIIIFAVLFFTLNSINLLSNGVISFFIDVPGLGNLIEGAGIGFFVAILYEILIFPIVLMAIANMVDNDSKLSATFRFKEIFNKIKNIGGGTLLIWYIITGIIFFLILSIGGFLTFFFFSLINASLAEVVLLVILIPYLLIYLARSVALFYMPQ